MSKKDVDRYYNVITEQYNEMVKDIQDFEEEVKNGLVEPERVERLKEQIEPIKQNWERWTYMMFLLNQPQRKSKKQKYSTINAKVLSKLSETNSVELTINENNAARKLIGT